MNVAVDIIRSIQSEDPVYAAFIRELLGRIAAKNPAHHFFIITGKNREGIIGASKDLEQLPAGPASSNPLLHRYWLNIQLPSLLKKRGAAVFVSTDGTCSLSAKIPQYMLISGMETLQKHGRNAVKYLHKATTVISFSGRLKEGIMTQYKIPATKIIVIKAAASGGFTPLSFEEKQLVKEQFTGGKEYFFFCGMINTGTELMNLLKAFSVFKKRQQSGIKLLLAGEMDKKDRSIAESLATYKYRDDLVLTGSLATAERARLLGAAYALVDTALNGGPGIKAIEAAACHVPVIAAAGQPLLDNDAFLEADISDYVDIAAQMMLLYKDETLRNALIQKARTAAEEHSMDRSTELLGGLILKTAQ